MTSRLASALKLVTAFALAAGCGMPVTPMDAGVDRVNDLGVDTMVVDARVDVVETGVDTRDVGVDTPMDTPPAVCGNSIREGSEVCDDGNSDDGDGCDNDCTFSCSADTDCTPSDACNRGGTCNLVMHRCSVGAVLPDGTTCGAARICRSGACVMPVCGDGTASSPEQCDDGNIFDGDGCDGDCTFSCERDADCADRNACNGIETCLVATHRCAPGTAAVDGADCDADANPGTPDVCRSGACRRSSCGDAIVDAARSEQCDDGNGRNGDGCENDCTFSCGSDSQCVDANPCNGAETCSTRACLAGTALPDGTACGTSRACRAGTCAASSCGNSTPDTGEDCDDGNLVNGDGCNNDCRFSCTTDPQCADGNPCNGTESCNTSTHRCGPGTALADGVVCERDGIATTRDVCRAATCRRSFCGDGFGDSGGGEQCDDGNVVTRDGCEADCRFSCGADTECADANACNGAESCTLATHTCTVASALPDGTVCDADLTPATRDVCRMTLCRRSVCGDGIVDAAGGETCEPPSPGCDPMLCTMTAPSTCGNGRMEAGEQCDDSNTNRWDGCSPTCRLEQTARANSLALIESGVGCDLTGDGRIDNQLGAALSRPALDQINMGIATAVDNGQTLVLTHFLDLDDRLGRNDLAIRMAFFSGRDSMAPFDGTAGEAFTIGRAELLASGEPRSVLAPGSIAATSLSAGPGVVTIRLNLSGAVTPLSLASARVTGTVVGDARLNRIDSVTGGRICGAISVGDLDRIAAPSGLPMNCVAVAPAVSSLLDLLVHGCVFVTPLVNSAQPDIDTGGDGVYLGSGGALQDTNGDRIIDTCYDGTTGTVIRGNDCAQDPRFDDAYSAGVSFTAIRVVIAGTHL